MQTAHTPESLIIVFPVASLGLSSRAAIAEGWKLMITWYGRHIALAEGRAPR
jgi:hypothetical protein